MTPLEVSSLSHCHHPPHNYSALNTSWLESIFISTSSHLNLSLHDPHPTSQGTLAEVQLVHDVISGVQHVSPVQSSFSNDCLSHMPGSQLPPQCVVDVHSNLYISFHLLDLEFPQQGLQVIIRENRPCHASLRFASHPFSCLSHWSEVASENIAHHFLSFLCFVICTPLDASRLKTDGKCREKTV